MLQTTQLLGALQVVLGPGTSAQTRAENKQPTTTSERMT